MMGRPIGDPEEPTDGAFAGRDRLPGRGTACSIMMFPGSMFPWITSLECRKPSALSNLSKPYQLRRIPMEMPSCR